jgi:predicted secreted protein
MLTARLEAKVDAILKETEAEITNQERMEAKFFRNFRTVVPNYTASRYRRLAFIVTVYRT